MHFLAPLSLPFLVYKMGPYAFLTGLLVGLSQVTIAASSGLVFIVSLLTGALCRRSTWGHLPAPTPKSKERELDSWAPAVRLTSGHRGPEGILQFGLVWFLFGEHSSHRAHATLNSQPPLSVRGSQKCATLLGWDTLLRTPHQAQAQLPQ